MAEKKSHVMVAGKLSAVKAVSDTPRAASRVSLSKGLPYGAQTSGTPFGGYFVLRLEGLSLLAGTYMFSLSLP